jgi:hypothetical protein
MQTVCQQIMAQNNDPKMKIHVFRAKTLKKSALDIRDGAKINQRGNIESEKKRKTKVRRSYKSSKDKMLTARSIILI